MRYHGWIAVCATMMVGMAVLAQQPLPEPNPHGPPGGFAYPVYPLPPQAPTPPGYPYAYPPSVPYPPRAPMAPLPPGGPYGQPTGPNGPFGQPIPPNGPYGQPMAPNGPYGQPMAPNGPYGQPMAPNGPYGQPMGPNGPYGQPMGPNGPYGQPMGPNMQFGNPKPMPMPVPPDPRMPIGQRGPSLPSFTDGAPKSAPTEPYFVQPDGPQTLPKSKPETKPGNIVTEPFNRVIQYIAPSGPSEPYTTYEGPRYQAEMKQDNTRVWAQTNFIHWWVRGDNTPPLVTTGNPNNPAVGTLGNADTVVVLGNGGVAPTELTGVQLTFGMWLDPERLASLELGGFYLGRISRLSRFAFDQPGNPAFAQPIIAGGVEGALIFAQPNLLAGSMNVSSVLDFHSLELNVARNVLRLDGWSLDWLAGFRYLYLNDALTINQDITLLPGGAGFIFYNGAPQPAGSNFLLNDSFSTTNRFYGGTIGARFNWTWNRFDLGAAAKVSFGATSHVAAINGFTTLVGNGTLPGSTLAQASNIGRFSSTDFSVVPELTMTAGFQITPGLRLLVGYNFLDWNRIMRVGNQIDRQIDFTQVPTSPTFAPGTVGANPRFPATRTDFWAQGINVGFELKY